LALDTTAEISQLDSETTSFQGESSLTQCDIKNS